MSERATATRGAVYRWKIGLRIGWNKGRRAVVAVSERREGSIRKAKRIKERRRGGARYSVAREAARRDQVTMGLVFPLALLTSLKLAMNTTPYLPGASAASVPSVAAARFNGPADSWPHVLSASPFRRGAAAPAAAATSDYDEDGLGDSGEGPAGAPPQLSSQVEQRGWSIARVGE